MAQRQWKLEEKLEVVLLGLKGEASVAELCRRSIGGDSEVPP